MTDNYLRKNIHSFEVLGQSEHIYFDKETEETHIQDNMEQTDKIDIYIRDSALKNSMTESNQNIYFAIECKRIKVKSDSKEYVQDIQKYVERNHTNLRLPFEAQIAFIENDKLNHKIISDEVNAILKETKTIITDTFLMPENLHNSFNETYLSKHKKNFENKDSFFIYHLMFDYSKVVLN